MNHVACRLYTAHRRVRGAGFALRAGAAWTGVLLFCSPACAQNAETQGRVQTSELAAAVTAPTPTQSALVPEVSAERVRVIPSEVAPSAPDGTPVSQVAAIDVRWWLLRGPASVRLGVGTLQLLHPVTDALSPSTLEPLSLLPTVSVGMRVLMPGRSALYADASGAMGLSPDTTTGLVRTKVGLEWKPAKSRLGLEEGRIGIQFDSGYRVSFRVRRGGLGVYLRGQF